METEDAKYMRILTLLGCEKRAVRWSGLQDRSNHAGHKRGVAVLVDEDGVTLPGYTLQIEVKAPIVVARCLYLFSIMHLQGGRRSVFYQLEVAPRDKRTHNAAKPIYGPHEHIMDVSVAAVDEPDVDCDNWYGSLQWFFERTNIEPFDIEDPNRDVEL